VSLVGAEGKPECAYGFEDRYLSRGPIHWFESRLIGLENRKIDFGPSSMNRRLHGKPFTIAAGSYREY